MTFFDANERASSNSDEIHQQLAERGLSYVTVRRDDDSVLLRNEENGALERWAADLSGPQTGSWAGTRGAIDGMQYRDGTWSGFQRNDSGQVVQITNRNGEIFQRDDSDHTLWHQVDGQGNDLDISIAGTVSFDKHGNYTFTAPDGTAWIDLPAGARICTDSSGNPLSIEFGSIPCVPRPQRQFESNESGELIGVTENDGRTWKLDINDNQWHEFSADGATTGNVAEDDVHIFDADGDYVVGNSKTGAQTVYRPDGAIEYRTLDVPPAPEPEAPARDRLAAEVTPEQLVALSGRQISRERAAEIVTHLNDAMAEYGINTLAREAAFLANVKRETANFTAFTEIGPPSYFSRYEGRRDLGNTHPGDGYRYRGRGALQITGRSNYRAASQALGIDLESNPDRAADLDVAFRVSGWFWTHGSGGNLNTLADAVRNSDITRAVRGGPDPGREPFYPQAWGILQT